MDKVLLYKNIIQLFSGTNRLFWYDKSFGNIRYSCKLHNMERNIYDAVKLYSGDKPLGLFVHHISEKLKMINNLFTEISELFQLQV